MLVPAAALLAATPAMAQSAAGKTDRVSPGAGESLLDFGAFDLDDTHIVVPVSAPSGEAVPLLHPPSAASQLRQAAVIAQASYEGARARLWALGRRGEHR